jgi:hypothetical protein
MRRTKANTDALTFRDPPGGNQLMHGGHNARLWLLVIEREPSVRSTGELDTQVKALDTVETNPFE